MSVESPTPRCGRFGNQGWLTPQPDMTSKSLTVERQTAKNIAQDAVGIVKQRGNGHGMYLSCPRPHWPLRLPGTCDEEASGPEPLTDYFACQSDVGALASLCDYLLTVLNAGESQKQSR
jgi:hypothetical protein